MKFAKIILALVFFMLCGVIAYMFAGGPGKKVGDFQDDEFVSYREGKRGDDPLYSEEIRKNTALTQSTLSRQQELENQQKELQSLIQNSMDKINRKEEKSDLKIAKQSEKLKKEVQDLTKQLDEIKSDSENNEQLANVRDTMLNQVEKLNKTLVNLQKKFDESSQNSQNKIKELETYISGELENAKQNLIGDFDKKVETVETVTGGVFEPNADAKQPAQVEQPINRNKTYPYGHSLAMTNTNPNGNKQDSIFNAIDELGNSIVGGTGAPTADKTTSTSNKARENSKKSWPTVFPVYTLPPNTILAKSQLITPIIGKIPVTKSKVLDPFFFKVEISSNNIAANGHEIPGVDKMIASGYSTGIREQNCVRGYIDSLTFIFIDGRIVNIGEASGEGNSNGSALGYLTDKWGKPCIRGEYISNARDYLKSKSIASFTQALADGLSQSMVEEKVDKNGNKSTEVNGSPWKYALSKGAEGSASEISEYVNNRASEAIDVIYVNQGVNVQIILNTMIPIDYDSNARKVNYYQPSTATSSYD